MTINPECFDQFNLNASLASSIYGKSSNVQPPAVQALIIIKI